MTNSYAKAYTEILEILKYLPKSEYEKIPKEKINFYENNKDNNYVYFFDSNKPLNEQNISKETNAIIISIFRDFFATPIQKEKLQKILMQNEKIYQDELCRKYNPDNIFKNKNEVKEGKDLIEIKHERWYEKIFSFFRNRFKK